MRSGRFPIASNRENYPKNNELYPWLVKRWCIGKITGDDLWHMEDVISLYEEPYDPMRPVVCFDERPCPLLGEVIALLPMKPGRSKRQHDEYNRNGTCCVLIAFEPRQGWRFVPVRERRTAVD